MKSPQRYAMLTVDTEALPRRASEDHVTRLIWGKHEKGTAGIREMRSIASEFNVDPIFFVDLCGAHAYHDEVCEVIWWLDQEGQDVQLHAHPEVLPEQFWTDNGFQPKPKLMNDYNAARAEFVLRHFGKCITDITGKDLLAFRAGSFRWNAGTIRAMKSLNIPLSFNNSMRGFGLKRHVYSEPTNFPYVWSNGVIEIPVTENRLWVKPDGREKWEGLKYPEPNDYQFQTEHAPVFAVALTHSWSLLTLDENGHRTYLNDRPLEQYRKFVARLTKDYDVITSRDFLDLYKTGEISVTQTVDLNNAEAVKTG